VGDPPLPNPTVPVPRTDGLAGWCDARAHARSARRGKSALVLALSERARVSRRLAKPPVLQATPVVGGILGYAVRVNEYKNLNFEIRNSETQNCSLALMLE